MTSTIGILREPKNLPAFPPAHLLSKRQLRCSTDVEWSREALSPRLSSPPSPVLDRAWAIVAASCFLTFSFSSTPLARQRARNAQTMGLSYSVLTKAFCHGTSLLPSSTCNTAHKNRWYKAGSVACQPAWKNGCGSAVGNEKKVKGCETCM